jgi:hypothetical protein
MENAVRRHRSTGADKWPPHRVDEVLDYASRKQWGRVGSALDAGFPVSAVGARFSLLHWAAYYGCVPMLRRLLASGAHVDVRGANQWTPAHHAAMHASADGLVVLVEAGADVNARDSFLYTPLHLAAMRSLPCARYLLTLPQVDLSATSKGGYTAEYKAWMYGEPAVADAVRAEVRVASWRCGDCSDLCSLATARVAAAHNQAAKGLSSQHPILWYALSYLCVVVRQVSARDSRWSPLRAAWVKAVVAGGTPGPSRAAAGRPKRARRGPQ